MVERPTAMNCRGVSRTAAGRERARRADGGLLGSQSRVKALEVDGASLGNGYVLGDYCHYHLKVGDAYVEASYRSSDSGLEVFGSSSKNAEGNYIAWHESLRLVPNAE
jgi:hypothetical protein